MYKVINGILVKCYCNDNTLILPSEVTDVFSYILPNNIEFIYGENVTRIQGSLNNTNLKGLYFPKLVYASGILCPNLLEFEVSDKFKLKKFDINPLVLKVNNNACNYSKKPKELLEYISGLYNLNIYRKYSNVIYLYNGDISYTYGDDESIINSIIYLNQLLSLMPQEVKEVIYSSNYKMFITNTYFSNKNEYMAGITFKGLKLCIVSEMHLVELLHEFGHIYDNEMNISLNPEFIDIYKEEKDKIKISNGISKEHIKNSNREYFAESFKKYILNKELFYEECPRTKEYMDRVLTKDIKCKHL